MIIIHGVQKLLNTSRLKPALFISQPDEKQWLHSWYARLLATGTSGKLLLMHVHQPSLMVVLCKGKTIQGTWTEFKQRLTSLMQRSGFPKSFIEREMNLMNGYVVSKTNSRSMLAFMNQMVPTLEHHIGRAGSYEKIPLDWLEDLMMEFIHNVSGETRYFTPLEFWQQIIAANKD